MNKKDIEVVYVASRVFENKSVSFTKGPQTSVRFLFLDKSNINFYENDILISREFLQDLSAGTNQVDLNDIFNEKIQEWIRKSDETPVSLEYIYKNYSPEMLRNALPYLRDLKLKNITE